MPNSPIYFEILIFALEIEVQIGDYETVYMRWANV
mgnify:FL=1